MLIERAKEAAQPLNATLPEFEAELARACARLAPLFERRAQLWAAFRRALQEVDESLRDSVPKPAQQAREHSGLVVMTAQDQKNAAMIAAVGAVNLANNASRK